LITFINKKFLLYQLIKLAAYFPKNLLLENVIEIPKKYTVPLKSSQKAIKIEKTTFDSGER
jgi:hypothetical protein